MRRTLTQPVRGTREAAGPERALIKALDRRPVVRLLGQDQKGKIVQAENSGAAPNIMGARENPCVRPSSDVYLGSRRRKPHM